MKNETDDILECEMIAHFMQYESDDDGNWLIETNYSSYEIGQDELVYDEQWSSSWDWLMPLVQECKCVKDADRVLIDNIDFYLCKTDLLGVYEAVVKFIKAQNV